MTLFTSVSFRSPDNQAANRRRHFLRQACVPVERPQHWASAPPALARSEAKQLDATAQSHTAGSHPVWCQYSKPLIWQGASKEAMQGVPEFECLSPTWKVMLLSDGSVTRHLELLTGAPVRVECLEMHEIGASTDGLPQEVSLVQGPYLQRQVLLRSSLDSAALVYAASWWNAATVGRYLQDESKPIWTSLSQLRTELIRDIRTVYYGNCPALEEKFGSQGPYWGRNYIFWTQQKPLTVIHEVFSTRLSTFLG